MILGLNPDFDGLAEEKNINWFFSNVGEFNDITTFINTSLQLDCPSANYNTEYLLASTLYLTMYDWQP